MCSYAKRRHTQIYNLLTLNKLLCQYRAEFHHMGKSSSVEVCIIFSAAHQRPWLTAGGQHDPNTIQERENGFLHSLLWVTLGLCKPLISRYSCRIFLACYFNVSALYLLNTVYNKKWSGILSHCLVCGLVNVQASPSWHFLRPFNFLTF